MSDRVDRKLKEVAVGRYGYRHEAEFAAGFLTDARIPFRLQVDDPAMGLAVSASATIWVLAMDADRAREVLELDGSHAARLSSPARGTPRRPPRAPGRAVVDGSHPSGATLSGRERVLSVLGGVLLAAAGGLLFADGGPVVVQAVLGAVVVLLVLVGLLGRAPGLLRGLLSALAGTAP